MATQNDTPRLLEDDLADLYRGLDVGVVRDVPHRLGAMSAHGALEPGQRVKVEGARGDEGGRGAGLGCPDSSVHFQADQPERAEELPHERSAISYQRSGAGARAHR